MLQETSIILGKNSNPMKKKTVLTIKVCTERKINIQYNTVPADVMHTVQFSFYIWAPAWSIYGLNTGGKASSLAYGKFNGYSARRVDLVVGV